VNRFSFARFGALQERW